MQCSVVGPETLTPTLPKTQVADLKQELEKQGLETKGLKLDLANRLIAFLATEDRMMAEDGKDRLQPAPHVHRSAADQE